MYGETAVINHEMAAVEKGLKERTGNVVCIHVCWNQEVEAHHYTSISHTRYQHFNQASIHFRKNIKGQRRTDLLSKQNECSG